MADSPKRNGSVTPYIVAVVILVLIGSLMVIAVLYLRQNLDPLLLIAAVGGSVMTIFSGIAAFLKSQETHLTVNSQLTAWKDEVKALSHAEGMIAGVSGEQARVAEQKRVLAAGPTTPTTPTATAPPVPVTVVSPDPLPVEVKK